MCFAVGHFGGGSRGKKTSGVDDLEAINALEDECARRVVFFVYTLYGVCLCSVV